MNFAVLVARLGVAEFARRAGVTPSTVKRWLRDGEPSYKYSGTVVAILRRHLSTLAGLATRRKAKERVAKASRDRALRRRKAKQRKLGAEVPADSELPSEQVLPLAKPRAAREVKAIKRVIGLQARSRKLQSKFVEGEITWKTVGKPIGQVDDAAISRQVVEVFDRSGRDYVSTKFLFFRFIPWNPIYKGELLRLQGKWVEAWQTTQAASAPYTIKRYIEFYLDRARVWAQSRVIYLEAIGISTFNYLRKPTKAELEGEQLS